MGAHALHQPRTRSAHLALFLLSLVSLTSAAPTNDVSGPVVVPQRKAIDQAAHHHHAGVEPDDSSSGSEHHQSEHHSKKGELEIGHQFGELVETALKHEFGNGTRTTNGTHFLNTTSHDTEEVSMLCVCVTRLCTQSMRTSSSAGYES